MADPIRIRAQAQGANAVVRLLVPHEMESGQRKDDAGRTVPAWHITEFAVRHNGRVVLNAMWGPGVAKNPYLQLTIRGAKAGDKVAVSWVDNRGGRRADEATVA